MASHAVNQVRLASEPKPARGGNIASNALVLWSIVLLGAVLRVIRLGYKSYWLDEVCSVGIARTPAPLFRHILWHTEGNMALYYLLLRPWLHFGYSEATVRVLSVLPGIASIPLMYLLGKRLFGPTVGILAALILAVNTCAIGASQDARAYSFVVLMVILSTYLFARFADRPSYSTALSYAIAAAVTCYFHFFGGLVPAAHAVSILALSPQKRPWKLLLLACAAIAVLASPVLWVMHSQDVHHIAWVLPPSWLELYHLGVYLASRGGKVLGGILLGLELVLAGFFVAAFRRAWLNRDANLRWSYTLIASTIVTPMVITLVVSIVRPVFYYRFLIICLPGWLLITAIGLMNIPRRAWRGAAIAVVCGLSLATTVLLYRRPSEDWRGAAHYLVAHSGPEDRVLYYPWGCQFAGEEYRSWLQPADVPRPKASGIERADGSWQREIEGTRRVWLVLNRVSPRDEQAQEIERELAKQYVVANEENLPFIRITEYTAR